MIDINKQINYWRNGAVEDLKVAQELVSNSRTRHGLFFTHLALEKLIKAHVCRQTRDIAPRIHNLVRLAELALLSLSQSHTDIIAELNVFSMEGRYPDTLLSPVSHDEAWIYLHRAEEVFQWLINQL